MYKLFSLYVTYMHISGLTIWNQRYLVYTYLVNSSLEETVSPILNCL